jgi:hypothetical protein
VGATICPCVCVNLILGPCSFVVHYACLLSFSCATAVLGFCGLMPLTLLQRTLICARVVLCKVVAH